jgi:multiple sugar transport system substrate-binding protein
MTEGSRRQIARRTVLEAIGGFAATGLVYGAYWLGSHEPEREWETVDPKRPLRVLSGRDDTANAQRRLLIDQWNAWHQDHQAEMIELPGVTDLQYSAVHAALQAEDSAVDVVNLDVPWIAEFAEGKHLEELRDVDETGFLKRPLDAARIDGGLYALPFNTDVGMLYYRKSGETDYAGGTLSVTEARHLTDWDRLRETIEQILAENPDFDGGIAMQLASYEGFTVNVWEYLLANGVEPDGDGMIDFGARSDAAGVLEELALNLHDEVREGAHIILQDALQHNEDESLLAFQKGRVPFLRHWPRAFAVLQSCDVDFEVGVVPMPGGVLGGQSLAVSAHSRRKNVSRALVEFLTGATSQQLLFERGGFAATREEPYFDAAAQVANLEGTPDESCEAVGGPRAEAREIYQALTGEGPGSRPAVKRYTQFSRAFRDALHPELESDAAPDLSGLESRLANAIEGK